MQFGCKWGRQDGNYGFPGLIFHFIVDTKDAILPLGQDGPFDTSFGRRAGFPLLIKNQTFFLNAYPLLIIDLIDSTIARI